MAKIDPDVRIKFKESIAVGQAAILSVEVIGGPILRVQAVVFSKDRKPLVGFGTPDFGPTKLTDNGGHADWLFPVSADAAYIKWGVQAMRSAAGIGQYGVTGKIRDGKSGDTLAVGRFNAVMDDPFVDDWIYDGVFLSVAQLQDLAPEPQA